MAKQSGSGFKFNKITLRGYLSFSGKLTSLPLLAYYRDHKLTTFVIVATSLISYFAGYYIESFWGIFIPIICIALSYLTIILRQVIHIHKKMDNKN